MGRSSVSFVAASVVFCATTLLASAEGALEIAPAFHVEQGVAEATLSRRVLRNEGGAPATWAPRRIQPPPRAAGRTSAPGFMGRIGPKRWCSGLGQLQGDGGSGGDRPYHRKTSILRSYRFAESA